MRHLHALRTAEDDSGPAGTCDLRVERLGPGEGDVRSKVGSMARDGKVANEKGRWDVGHARTGRGRVGDLDEPQCRWRQVIQGLARLRYGSVKTRRKADLLIECSDRCTTLL